MADERHGDGIPARKPAGPAWRVPLLASLSVGIPLMAGVFTNHGREAMLAATGAMVILYLPPAGVPVGDRILRLVVCALGFVVSFFLGACGTFHPLAIAPTLGVVTFLAAAGSRIHALAPPASFFFVVTAAIASNSRFDPGEIALKTLWVAAGAMVSIVVAGLSCAPWKRKAARGEGPVRRDRNLPAILVESAVIAASVTVSMAVARWLDLENPYWVPISCIAILQGGTFRAVWHRNIHRILGTALGMGLSWILFPPVVQPVILAVVVICLVFVVEFLVPRHYGIAVVFITPLTVCFAEIASGGAPFRDLLAARLIDITLGSLIGAVGGSVLHHPQWCRRAEAVLRKLVPG